MSGKQAEECYVCGDETGLKAAGRNGVFRPICVGCMMKSHEDLSILDRIKSRVSEVL